MVTMQKGWLGRMGSEGDLEAGQRRVLEGCEQLCMTDHLDEAERSWNMSWVRGKGCDARK